METLQVLLCFLTQITVAEFVTSWSSSFTRRCNSDSSCMVLEIPRVGMFWRIGCTSQLPNNITNVLKKIELILYVFVMYYLLMHYRHSGSPAPLIEVRQHAAKEVPTSVHIREAQALLSSTFALLKSARGILRPWHDVFAEKSAGSDMDGV